MVDGTREDGDAQPGPGTAPPGDGAVPLVALHGFTEIDLSWTEVFAAHGRAITAPLLPGHGWRPCPVDASVASTAADLAAELPATPCDLLGYSMGGRLALRLALDHPQRVRRLLLVSCRPGLADPERRECRRQRDERLAEILEDDGIGPFVAWWERQAVLRPFTAPTPSCEQILRSRRLNQNPLGLAAALRRLGQGAMQPLWDRLGELRMPVLLIAGEGDGAFVADMRRMQAAISGAQLRELPSCGHAIHREHPRELVHTCLEFLEAAPG